MVDPGAFVRFEWGEKVPLRETWTGCSEGKNVQLRGPALAYWIEKSETDKWTFDQLIDQLDALLDSGRVPTALERWRLEFIAGKTRTGGQARARAAPWSPESRASARASWHRKLADHDALCEPVIRKSARAGVSLTGIMRILDGADIPTAFDGKWSRPGVAKKADRLGIEIPGRRTGYRQPVEGSDGTGGNVAESDQRWLEKRTP